MVCRAAGSGPGGKQPWKQRSSCRAREVKVSLHVKSVGSQEGTYRNWTGCGAVDQGVDRVRLISIVGREDAIGQGGRVVGDQLGEVVGNLVGVGVTQAKCVSGLSPAVGNSDGRASEEGGGPDENGGTHG